MAALDGAVPLAEMDHVPVRVGKHLHLDVAGILEVALDVDAPVGEVLLPFALGRLERALGLVGRGDELHPLAAAAGRGLDDQRVADLVAEAQHLGHRLDRLGRARDDRDAGRLHRGARLRLRPHQLDRRAGRADPRDPRLLDRSSELGVLGEEAVAGMDRVGAGLSRRVQDPLADEVALRGRTGADQIRLVGGARMECIAVGLGVDGDRADSELAQRPEDPDRDLAAVGDEHFRRKRHGARILTEPVTLPDQLTVARAASVPLVVLLYAWEFPNNEYWATAVFCIAMATDWLDGRIARSRGVTSQLGSLLDPIADKVLVLAVLVMLIDDGVWPGWMVAAIVAREILISGLRLAAIERGVVIAARDLGKLKTWAQAVAAALGGFAAAGAWDSDIAWWALLVALILTWVSGLDYARAAPRLLRGTTT